jgi:hypothetical protein
MCPPAFLFGALPIVQSQQSDVAPPPTAAQTTPSSVPPKADNLPPIPIIQLKEQPPIEPKDSMTLVSPEREPPTSAQPSPHVRLPELTTDENGSVRVARASESFSNLTLEGSELKSATPIFGSREVNEKFIRELWQFQWRPNDPIDLYIILPRNVEKPPISLYLYGYPNETDRFKNDGWCERVTRNGVAAIGFVSALTGQRYANRPFKEWFVSELPESLAATVHDVQMILNRLADRPDLDTTHVGMFAQGSGATIAILAASVDKRIQALDLLDPWGDWPDWFAKAVDEFPENERATYLAPGFQKKLESLEPVKALPALQDRKLRILFNEENGEPLDAVKRLAAAAPTNAEIQHFRGRQMADSYAGGRLFLWMAAQLHPTPLPQ